MTTTNGATAAAHGNESRRGPFCAPPVADPNELAEFIASQSCGAAARTVRSRSDRPARDRTTHPNPLRRGGRR